MLSTEAACRAAATGAGQCGVAGREALERCGPQERPCTPAHPRRTPALTDRLSRAAS